MTSQPASQLPDPAWMQLESALRDYLRVVDVRSDRSFLLLELPHTGAADTLAPYLQVSTDGGGTVQVELSANGMLSPAHQLDEAAVSQLRAWGWQCSGEFFWFAESSVATGGARIRQALFALREFFGVAHPQLLTYTASGSGTVAAGGLGLVARSKVARERTDRQVFDGRSGATSDADEIAVVRAAVGSLLAREVPGLVRLDDEGWFEVWSRPDQPYFVMVSDHPTPAVQLRAPVAWRMKAPQRAALEVARLNVQHPWLSWQLDHDAVSLVALTPIRPFVEQHFLMLLRLFDAAYRSVDLQLLWSLQAYGSGHPI